MIEEKAVPVVDTRDSSTSVDHFLECGLPAMLAPARLMSFVVPVR